MIDLKTIQPHIARLAQKYHLTLVVLFGSQVTGKIHAHSDVDIGFVSARTMRPRAVAEMQLEFSYALKTLHVELVDITQASPLLLRTIAQKSLLLYEQEPMEYLNFKIYAFKRHMEAKPLLDLRASKMRQML